MQAKFFCKFHVKICGKSTNLQNLEHNTDEFNGIHLNSSHFSSFDIKTEQPFWNFDINENYSEKKVNYSLALINFQLDYELKI